MTSPIVSTAALRRPTAVLVTLLTCQLILVLDLTVVNVALPQVRAELGFGATELSWVVNAYTLAFGGLLLLGGRAGDLFGRKRMFLAGIALFTLASLVGGFAVNAAMLLVARTAQGVGAAMAGPSTIALLTTTFTEPSARTRALSWLSGTTSAGFAVGLILGGLLTQYLSWRSVFFINVPVGVLAVAAGRRLLSEPPRRPVRLDLPGAIAAGPGIAAVVYGFISAAARGWEAGVTIGSLAAGVVLLTTFVAIEMRAAQPLLPLWLFADRDRAAAYVNVTLGSMASVSMFFYFTQYLQEVRGYDALAAGFAFLPFALMVFGASRMIPRLLPIFGVKPLALAGTVALIAGLVVLTQLTAYTAYFPVLFCSMLLVGLGMGLAVAPLSVTVMSAVPPADAGAAGGALQTAQQAGAALGVAVLVTIFSHRTHGMVGSTQDTMVIGVTSAFLGSVLIGVLSLLVALRFRKQ